MSEFKSEVSKIAKSLGFGGDEKVAEAYIAFIRKPTTSPFEAKPELNAPRKRT